MYVRTRVDKCMRMRACMGAWDADARGRACYRACSLTYPACTAYEPYCLRPLWLRHIFGHYLINGTIFGKRLPNTKRVLIFSTTFIWNIFYSTNSERYCHKCENVFMYSTRYSCQILTILECSQKVFDKSSNIKFHQNPAYGSGVFSSGRPERHDVAKSRFSQFCKRA